MRKNGLKNLQAGRHWAALQKPKPRIFHLCSWLAATREQPIMWLLPNFEMSYRCRLWTISFIGEGDIDFSIEKKIIIKGNYSWSSEVVGHCIHKENVMLN